MRRKSRGTGQVIILLAIPLVILISLFWLRVEEGNKADTAAGLDYIRDLETLNIQDVEQNLNSTAGDAGAATEERPEASTEESVGSSSEDSGETSTEESTEAPEPSTEAQQPSTEAPQPSTEAPEPSTEALQPSTEVPQPSTEAPQPSTEAPEPSTEAPQPSTETPEPPVVQGQSYVPYEIDQAKVQATLAQLNAYDVWSNEYINLVKALYQDALFVGDSITSGFSLYKIVNENNVIAEVGGTVYNHLPNNLEKIIQYNPKILFLHYGLNEMSPSQEGMKSVLDTYAGHIQYLKDHLPNTRIIVLALGPVTDAAIERQSRFTWIGAYNDYMKTLCQGMGVGFYQDDAFFYGRLNLYNKDGIHIQPQLYREWIKDITEEMGIYQ